MKRLIHACLGGITSRGIRRTAFSLPFLLALILVCASSLPGLAQQGGLGDSLLQLQQLQRAPGAGGQEALPQDMVIQPVRPEPHVRLPASRLEQILSARAGVRLEQFGYDQLGSGRSVTVPQTGSVQDDYILGPNDEIVISLRGQENSEFRTTVDRNGMVVMPRLSPISASGRSFGSFRQDVEAAVRRAYVATQAFVSVGRLRQINVLVSGEVNYPGQRLLTGLSSTVDALLISGGVKKSGSLRNIRIQRGGREYAVDLYSVLTGGAGSSRMTLADGDRIIVPPLGRTVAVSGLVRRPGIYELAGRQPGVTVSALLSLAGGEEVRGQYRLSVLRTLADGRSDLAPVVDQKSLVHDSEILFVQLGASQTVSRATLSGGTGLAGTYSVTTGTRLSDVIGRPGALGNAPYTPFGIIVRRDPRTLLWTLVPFTPLGVLQGKEDQTLQTDDVIRVFSVNEAQLLTFVVREFMIRVTTAQNSARNPVTPERQNLQPATITTPSAGSAQDAQMEDISSVPAEIQRREILQLLDTPAPGSPLAREEARKAAALRLQQSAGANPSRPSIPNGYQGPNAQIPPGQNPQLQQQDGMTDQQSPQDRQDQDARDQQIRDQETAQQLQLQDDRSRQPDASQNFMGDQALAKDAFAPNSEVQTFGELTRQLGIDPLTLVNFLIDRRVRIDGAVHAPGYYFVGPSVSLQDLVQAAGGTINWADESGVELLSTIVDTSNGRSATQRQNLPLRQGTLATYIVRPHDRLRFNSVFTDVGFGSVTVQGEVRNPGVFSIVRGEHLSDLIARAGGLTSIAYPYGTIFLRQSAAQTEREGYQRAANEIQSQLIIAMTRIGNDKLDANTFASMQTFVSELRNQRALGRISVVADPGVLTAKPELDPLLEANDSIYVPQRPATISVLGQVLQPGSYPYRSGETLRDYIDRAGGYASTADSGQTFIVLPDGSARRVEKSWLSFDPAENLPPGSAIVVPRDVTPLDLRQTIIDVSQIFSQFAVAIASVAVISRQ